MGCQVFVAHAMHTILLFGIISPTASRSVSVKFTWIIHNGHLSLVFTGHASTKARTNFALVFLGVSNMGLWTCIASENKALP